MAYNGQWVKQEVTNNKQIHGLITFNNKGSCLLVAHPPHSSGLQAAAVIAASPRRTVAPKGEEAGSMVQEPAMDQPAVAVAHDQLR